VPDACQVLTEPFTRLEAIDSVRSLRALKLLMLYEFILENRDEILQRARANVAARPAPTRIHPPVVSGLPVFLDELAEMIRNQAHSHALFDQTATRHGRDRFEMGYTVTQVVQDFGDICQVVTQLAIERSAPITTEEFRLLNLCLDVAIARSVTEHTLVSQNAVTERNTESLGFLAHELRNHLGTASLAYEILKSGKVAIGGNTGAVLGRALAALRGLIDRSLIEVRLDAGVRDVHPIEVFMFLQDMELAGTIAAEAAQMTLSTDLGERGVTVAGDGQLLASAVSNLLQNAFKYSKPGGHVSFKTTASDSRVRIEVADQCGGLSPEVSRCLFTAFSHSGKDRSGLGLGLSISRRAVETMHGGLHARSIPGQGCVFTIDLPRLTAKAMETNTRPLPTASTPSNRCAPF